MALYKQTAFKTSELTVSGATINFLNSKDVSATTSVSSLAGNSNDLAVGGNNNINLFTQFNDLGHVYTDVVVKNTTVSVVEVGGVFYSVYTDNGDNKIKIRDVAEPLSITRFEVPGQDGPTVIDGQAGTVDIKVEGGTDLTNLVATYSITSDVTEISVEIVPQTSAVTANDFSLPLTYVLSDGVTSRNWLVSVSVGILDTIEVDICEGDSYVFGTQTLFATGEYLETFTAANESDSTVLLILTVNPVYNHTVQASICEGNTYMFGTQTLTTAGEYEETFTSLLGCDSIVTLTLTVNPVYNHTDAASICEGESFTFGTQALTTAGEYEETFSSLFGCDSTVTLTLTVNPVYNHTDIASICKGESFTFGTQTLTTAGEYEEIFSSVFGCDSIVTLTLIVYPVYNHTDIASICQGESFIFGTKTLTTAGEYEETFTSVHGCDSIVTLTLTVNPVYNHTDIASICQGESIIFGTKTLTIAGEYEETFTSVYGCDSIVTLTLTVNPMYNHAAQASICQGESFTLGEQTLTAAGEYKETFTSVHGCDSIVTLTLTVNPRYNHVDVASICQGESFTFGTQILTTAGEYEETFTTIYGCDSTVTLTLTVYPSYNNPVSDCEMIKMSENVYLETSDLLANIHAEYGDGFSIADWNDLVAIADIDAWITCMGLENEDLFWIVNSGQHFWDGSRHYFVQYYPGGAPGFFTVHAEIGNKLFLGSWYGLQIPILAKNNNPTVEIQVCSNELPFIFGSQTLTEPGQYTEVLQTIHGCDSTVTITLTVNPVYNHTEVANICEGESFTFGTQTLTTAGEYEETFTSIHGCDSSVTLTLTVNPVYTHTAQASICPGESFMFGTQTITTAGEYVETFSSVFGCDSIVTLTLTVNPVYTTTQSVTVYEDDLPMSFGSQSLTNAGIYIETFTSVTGCDSIVTLTLTVKPADITPPTIICNSISVSLNSSGLYVLNENDILDITEGTTDNDSEYDDLTIRIVPNSFSCIEAGTNVPVMVIVTDLRENTDTCYTTVMVIDETVPEITCKNTSLVLDENGYASLNPVDVYSSVYDACGIQSVIVSREQFGCEHIGNNTILVTATDNNNNSQTCTATVTISDNLSPVFSPVEDLTITVNEGECTATISYPVIIASDNCGTPAIVQIEGLGSDGVFPLGAMVERWVATDISGNTDTLSFVVNVLKNPVNPSVDSIANVEILEDSGWFIIQLTGIYDGSDCEDYALDFSLILTNDNLLESYTVIHVAGEDTATLKALPALNYYGASEVTLTVVNSETGKDFSIGFSISILPDNDAPFTVQPVGNLEINTGDILKVFFNPEKGMIFDDVDEDDILQLSLVQANDEILPEWLVFRNDSLIATPMAADAGCIELILVATDLSGETAFSPFTLCVYIPVGINLPENLGVKVYPNPTTGKIYIDFTFAYGNEIDISVVDILGREVLRKNYPAERHIEVDLSDKVSGIYFLNAKTDAGVEFNRKIIVSKVK